MSETATRWTAEDIPSEEYWGAILRVHLSEGTIRLRCATRSLRDHAEHADAIVALLLASIRPELQTLMGVLPTQCAISIDVHDASSPYLHPPERGTAFQYWLRVFDTRTHLYFILMTHEHQHDDRGTLQCIVGLRNACAEWVHTLQPLTPSSTAPAQ